MQFKKSAVVGVLIMLCLSTDSWCHYIPEKKTKSTTTTTTGKKNGTAPPSEQIQMCGNELTNFIIEACDGILGSFGQVNSTRSSIQTKITEDCCDQECPLDYLQNYCGKTPLFTTMKTLRGKLLGKSARNRATGPGAVDGTPVEGKRKGVLEVRVREKKHGERKWGKRRKKRKKAFKRKCAYKSFGHYLLKLDRRGSGRARHDAAKGSNGVNRTWPSIEIGTISPEIEKFGGQPIIVVRKNKSNSS